MKNLSLLAPILAAVVLIACTPTNAASRIPMTGLGVWRSTPCSRGLRFRPRGRTDNR